jgi:hypothetical protein
MYIEITTDQADPEDQADSTEGKTNLAYSHSRHTFIGR